MAATAKRPRPVEFANGHSEERRTKTKTYREQTKSDDVKTPRTINELIRARAIEPDSKDKPILSYPESGRYIDYTPAQLNELADNATFYYAQCVPRRFSSDDPVRVVAVLGPSNFDYFITLLALSKLGHTVLLLSTRISEEAHLSLFNATKATSLFVDDAFRSMGEKVQKHLQGLTVEPIATKADYATLEKPAESESNLDIDRETRNVAWIIHSSGSTSLPQPVFVTHGAAISNYKTPFPLVAFVTLPLFHTHGLGCVFRAINVRRHIYMLDAALPLTTQHLTRTLTEHPDIQVFYTVPYALKLLAESEEAMRLLARCEAVCYSGSACPKPIGDKLVESGVFLVGYLGNTECGQLASSMRDRNDLDWDYFRPTKAVQPFLRWDNYAPGIYEMVVLEGWPSKVATNQEDGSFATKDLFEKHPEKDAWRYYARKDDTIVLVNGEKANPLLLEGVAKENARVAEAVVFGAQKPHIGMFVLPARPNDSEEDVVNAIWPDIEKANKVEPGHARLSKDMIRLLPPDLEYRKTDKSTVIRAAFYKQFAPLIDAIYEESAPKGSLALDEDELRAYLRSKLQDLMQSDRIDMLKDNTDLFALGVDSLQASQIRGMILKNLDVGKETPGQNFVFDFPSVNAMATELLRMRTGAPIVEHAVEERMQSMIERYGHFEKRIPVRGENASKSVLVTGATGSLGAHVVAQLASMTSVDKVYCLVRARSPAEAARRVEQSMQQRKIWNPSAALRIVCLPSDLSSPTLGLAVDMYEQVASNISAIIHCAWTVNFNLSLESFENDCVAGTRHLLDLCLYAKRPGPTSFNFCSSVSAVAATPGDSAPEELPGYLSYAQDMGYAQSKLVTEHICMNAAKATGLVTRILRTGQIIGDTKHGVWNAQEAIPIIFQCAETIGALPELDESPSWLPVDVAAAGLIELSLGEGVQSGVYHVNNHRTLHWSALLGLLKDAGLIFEAVDQREWIRCIRALPDPVTNPPYKLLEFFASKYDREEACKGLTYVSDKARAHSPSLAQAPVLDQALLTKIVQHLQTVW